MSFVANLCSGFLANRFSRRKMIVATYLAAALPTALFSLLDTKSSAATPLMFVAKLSISGNFNLTSLMSVEAFPIQVRNTAYGIIEFTSLLFNAFLPYLTRLDPSVLTLCFSASSFLGMFAATHIPDKTD